MLDMDLQLWVCLFLVWQQGPTDDFSIIPSWSKEFSCLIGLEEVVQFRLERLDKTVYTAANKHGTRGTIIFLMIVSNKTTSVTVTASECIVSLIPQQRFTNLYLRLTDFFFVHL